jgi:alpha-aminoadipate carrier protein LysW
MILMARYVPVPGAGFTGEYLTPNELPKVPNCRIVEFLGGAPMVTCPVCEGTIDVEQEDVDEGDTISCDECGADLKVVGTDPLEVESAEDEEEEDDEDDFLEDDEEEEESEEDWK